MAWTRGKGSVIDDSKGLTDNLGDCWRRKESRNDNREIKKVQRDLSKELRTSIKLYHYYY